MVLKHLISLHIDVFDNDQLLQDFTFALKLDLVDSFFIHL